MRVCLAFGVCQEAVLHLPVSSPLRTLASARCHASPLLPLLSLVGQQHVTILVRDGVLPHSSFLVLEICFSGRFASI